MAIKTVAVIGATGLIGSRLIAALQSEKEVETIKAVVRRPVAFQSGKVEMKLVNFDDLESLKLAIEGSDAVFCAIGTTQKKVKGDMDAYRKVDYDIPINTARACAETGCKNFLLVSSVGANRKSNNFYLKLKGEVENAVKGFPIRSISIFRPSFLLGRRTESRLGEKAGQVLVQALSFLLIGSLKKYKPIKARDVANAMISAAKKEAMGIEFYEYEKMIMIF